MAAAIVALVLEVVLPAVVPPDTADVKVVFPAVVPPDTADFEVVFPVIVILS